MEVAPASGDLDPPGVAAGHSKEAPGCGLTVAGVVAAFHHWRVLPLTDRWLRLDEMTPKVSVESSRMASAALLTDELLRRVKGTVGKADYSVVVPMRPEQGYVSLVNPLFLSIFFLISPLLVLPF